MISTVRAAANRVGPKCRLWVASGFITAYLGILGVGLFCHTFGWKASSHPAMYFVVWDMFCGWAAYEARFHVIAEGVSGEYYHVLPGPWDEFQPYGNLARHHYDVEGTVSGKIAMNVLRQTSHEDMTRLFIIEENWPKKFNMPDEQWNRRWDEPKNPHRYYTVRHVITPQGLVLQTYDSFYVQQHNRELLRNPRLTAEMSRSQPFYAFNLRQDGSDSEAAATPRFGSPLGH